MLSRPMIIPTSRHPGALYVNSRKVGEAHNDKTVRYLFSFDETLNKGRDGSTPVSDDYPMRRENAFNGKIHSVTLDIGPNPTV